MVKKGTIARAAFAAVLILILLALAIGYSAFERNFGTDTSMPPAIGPPSAVEEAHPSFLYGRVAVAAGATYEGRLRWGRGRGQEAFWGDYFNGFKSENPWAVHVPPERLGKDPIKIFGIEIGGSKLDLGRPFMARFGDLARIESLGRDVRLTLKSGRYSSPIIPPSTTSMMAYACGTAARGSGRRLPTGPHHRFLAAPRAGPLPHRLHGDVHTRSGDFTGFVQWNRDKGLGTDELVGRTADGDLRVRFDTIRSIARKVESSLVTLLDGREILLTGPESGHANLGIYVDDPRFGRVLVSWDTFERLDFSPGGSGPAYGDFPPGIPLSASSPLAPAGASRAGSSTTSTRARPPKRSTRPLRAWTIDSVRLDHLDRAARPRRARQGDALERRATAARSPRRSRRGEWRHADLRRRQSAAGIRALDRCRTV